MKEQTLDSDTLDYNGCFQYLIYSFILLLLYGIGYNLLNLRIWSIFLMAILFFTIKKLVTIPYSITFKQDCIVLKFMLTKRTQVFDYQEVKSLKHHVFSNDSFGGSESLEIQFKSNKKYFFVCTRELFDEINNSLSREARDAQT
jgi:hypothetical protein